MSEQAPTIRERLEPRYRSALSTLSHTPGWVWIVIGGVVLLWNMGSYPVALVILIASVLVPIGKILTVATLCWTIGRHQPVSPRQRMTLYRITEFIGKWSMVDVFVISILVTLVQLGAIATIESGPAATAFCVVVVLTILSATSFDPRLVWDAVERDDRREGDRHV